MNPQKIRVRFAPSPTGYLHVGGARTALFNYLFAKHFQGQFLLRIEDTDMERSNEKYTEQILKSLRWLGLLWDEELYFQADHSALHQKCVQKLLDTGFAYRCFCSRESLEERRKTVSGSMNTYQYDRKCCSLSIAQIQVKLDNNIPFVVRFRIPEGVTQFQDLVYGNISVQNSEMDDFVLLRSDGSPIYQVAVVVDDHELGITHAIRGEDHLSNTPKQILLYQALGWEVPQFAHLPMILGPDKKRLSKRHGATSVEEFQNQGYLSESLVNFLVLLGWAPGDDREIFSLNELCQIFTLDRISRKSSVFDETKLSWMNHQYFNNLKSEDIYDRVIHEWAKTNLIDKNIDSIQKSYFLQIITLLKSRIKYLPEFTELAHYYFCDPSQYEEKAVQKYWMKEGAVEYLTVVLAQLKTLKSWEEEDIENCIRYLAEKSGVGPGKLIHPVRLAITGLSVSPGLFEVMVLLGQETVLRRIQYAIKVIQKKLDLGGY